MNTKITKVVVLSFLLLTSYTLLCVNSNAQTKFTSPSLEGTKWKGKAGIILGGGLLVKLELDYDFMDEARFHMAITMKTYRYDELKFNPNTNTWNYEVSVDPDCCLQSTSTGQATGTYKLNGNSILINVPNGHQIEGRIEDDRMIGVLTTGTGKEGAWSAVKVAGNIERKVEPQNTSNNVYGPWGNYENLHSAILSFFYGRLDKENAARGITDQKYIQAEKKYIEELSESSGIHPSFYESAEIGSRIASRLNRFFNKDIFNPEDFQLYPSDVRKKRNVSANSQGGVTGDGVLRPSWTISRFIRERYIPVVRRALANQTR